MLKGLCTAETASVVLVALVQSSLKFQSLYRIIYIYMYSHTFVHIISIYMYMNVSVSFVSKIIPRTWMILFGNVMGYFVP